MGMHEGSCHCGAINISMASEPIEAGECNCSICRRNGALWHYCSPELVTVTGKATGYVQGDCMLTNWHCGTCGITTHWTIIDDPEYDRPEYDRMGVNLRLFDPAIWAHLPRKMIDGASF